MARDIFSFCDMQDCWPSCRLNIRPSQTIPLSHETVELKSLLHLFE